MIYVIEFLLACAFVLGTCMGAYHLLLRMLT